MCRFLVKTLCTSRHAVAMTSLLAASAVAASEVTIPHTFQANTPAVAAEVNANFGAVEVAVDDSASRIADLEATIASLQSTVNTLQNQMSALQSNSVLALDGALGLVTDPATGQPTARFVAVNVQVVNGLGSTATANSTGNLIVGYNEYPGIIVFCANGHFESQQACESAGYVWAANQRSGSHNLLVGGTNAYSRWGGLIAGLGNVVNSRYSSVNGGSDNIASGDASTVGGGTDNTASGNYASVGGGKNNVASGTWSSANAGYGNQAYGLYSTVNGGASNEAYGNYSSVSGGQYNAAEGQRSSVNGGQYNNAFGANSSIGGGRYNDAAGDFSTVSGGHNRDIPASGTSDWKAGSLHEVQ